MGRRLAFEVFVDRESRVALLAVPARVAGGAALNFAFRLIFVAFAVDGSHSVRTDQTLAVPPANLAVLGRTGHASPFLHHEARGTVLALRRRSVLLAVSDGVHLGVTLPLWVEKPVDTVPAAFGVDASSALRQTGTGSAEYA